jgi:catechol 2,3-dioxygenase-like lactoylglutathione lyase family enzyme
MAILLDHLIVPSRDPVPSAQFLATLLDVPWEAERGHFTPVYVNDTLTLDFAQREHFASHHYCFHVNDEEFDGIFARVRTAGIPYRSTPLGADDLQLNTRMGGRNFYWNDSDGHIWEVLTVSYARQHPEAPVGLASS